MRIDVNAFVGHYPFRRVEGGSPAALRAAMERNRIDQAWISNLAAVYWKDPTEGNAALYRIAADDAAFRPVPAIHPGMANWRAVLAEARDQGAPAVRIDPLFQGVGPLSRQLADVLHQVAEARLPVMMAVRLEDGRQRHPHDVAPDLDAATVRALIRLNTDLRIIVTHADREMIEQVHFGSTPGEAGRLLWDICWLWGPPMDDFTHLVRAVGPERFCFGTGMPLRIPESSVAKLELLDATEAVRTGIDGGNLTRFLG